MDINIKYEGLKEEINNKGTIWRLRIKSYGAFSLNLTFGKFKIPYGSELFIYNLDKSQKSGAFTDNNNNSNEILPISPIKGDEIIVEYFEPFDVDFSGILILTRIGHDYVNILDKLNLFDGNYGTSQGCNIDINCSQASNWQTEKNSVCRILIDNINLCTGSLMNNANNDGTPYILTANHCIDNNNSANNSVFVFNYESPYCDGPDGSISHSISVSTLRSTWATSDFTLVEMSSKPRFCYQPYYNGWDNSGSTPSSVVCIHHPTGDVKKFSQDNSSPTTDGTYFWKVTDYDIGTVEHGSSGAPFYNSDHRVIGQVSSGNNIFCNSNEWSTYGKISESWAGGGTSSTQLSHWLDPEGESLTYLNGYIPNDPSISGSSVLCASGSEYTLNDLPPGATLAWSCSQNITRISNPESNPCTFQANGTGTGWIRATISSQQCDDNIITNNIWVGYPSAPTVYPASPIYESVNSLFSISITDSPGADPSTGVWETICCVTPNGTPSGSLASFYSCNTDGLGIIYVSTSNDCGSYYKTSISVVTGAGGDCEEEQRISIRPSVLVYPNPASEFIEVSLYYGNTYNSPRNSNYTIKIFDIYSKLLKILKVDSDCIRIPVNDLPKGTYFLVVSQGKNNIQTKFIVQ